MGLFGGLSLRSVVAVVMAVLRRPDLWVVAVRQLVALSPSRWWTRAPWLPIPDVEYLRFRLQTAYGDPRRSPDPRDVVTYLQWCRVWPASR